jgi:hypothetical protein
MESKTLEEKTIEHSPATSDKGTDDGYALDAAAIQDHDTLKTTKDGRTVL